MCDIQAWPQTDVVRAAPPVNSINKGMLSVPKRITREEAVRAGIGGFTDTAWVGGRGTWDWGHQIGRARRFAGEIRLQICVAPNSQAAYECLMRECSTGSLPIELVKAEFSQSRRLDGIGTLGFGGPSSKPGPVMFVRDNIAVRIVGYGDLGSETLPLARKIDALILKQPAESRKDLMARAPSITISMNLKTDPYVNKSLPFEVSAPAGHRIIYVGANADHESLLIRDAEISLGRRVGKTRIKVVAITDELLVGTREIEVDIPGD